MDDGGLRIHAFICTNKRDPAHPKKSCGSRGALDILSQLKKMARESGLNDVRINKSGCLGKCEEGPACVVYPEGNWHRLSLDKDEMRNFVLGLSE